MQDILTVIVIVAALNGPNVWYLRGIRTDLQKIFGDVHHLDTRLTAAETRAKLNHPQTS